MTAGESELTPTAAQKIGARSTTRARGPRISFKGNWWRHLVALFAVVVALFPVVFIVSSAFNRDNTLSGAQVIPTHVTLHNFGNLLHNNVETSGGG
jgi:arabinogalactan oligomer / maltooligosaccharide transport system permease protein